MSIIISDGVKISKRNTPTREGERIATIAEMASIPNPYVGQRVYVEDEGFSYEIKSLKAKIIDGVVVENAQVDLYEPAIPTALIDNLMKKKFGYARDLEGNRQFFADEESASLYDENPEGNAELLLLELKTAAEGGGGGAGGGMYYFLRVMNGLPSRSIVASQGEPCEIKFTFVSQQKDGAEAEYEDTGERGYCELSVSNIATDSFQVVKSFYVNSGVEQTVDVSQFLATGANSIRLKITGEITEQVTPAFTWSAQLTSLSIGAPNFEWWKPNTGDFTIPFIIGGNVDKDLYISVDGGDYHWEKMEPIGPLVYTDTPLNYGVPHPGKSGVYTVRAQVKTKDSLIATKELVYETICVVQGETETFIAVNNVSEGLTNWAENAVLDYALYSPLATTSIEWTLGEMKQALKVTTGEKKTLDMALEVETVDDSDFTLVLGASSGGKTLVEGMVFEVDNSQGFSPVAGAAFYFNPRKHDNGEAFARTAIINEISGEEIPAVFTGYNWGSDGYQKVTDGLVMRVFAGNTLEADVKFFAKETATTGATLSMDFRVDNALDYEGEVLKVIEETASNFVGVKLLADSMYVHSQAAKNDDYQGLRIEDRERIHVDVVIMPQAYGNKNFNLVILYVNGCKNREFTYASNDYFANQGNLIIGSESADIDIYGIKVYYKALTANAIQQNHINWLNEGKEEYKARNDVFDAKGESVDIDKVRRICNVITFFGEMPSKSNPNKFINDWKLEFVGRPEWNVFIKGIEQSGQGTSAMEYDGWNQKGKSKSTTVATYADGSTTTGFFYLAGRKCRVAAGKLNWASSCGCNKMGSVNSIGDLCELLGILDKYNSRVGIFQMPFVGFQALEDERGNMRYTFTGLYTLGPDKGDPFTMGWDYEMFPDLISVEGADNAAPGALFKVPWNKDKKYWDFNMDEESMQYNGINCFDYNAGKAETKGDIKALYEKMFMPRYNFIYECSPNLTYWGDISTLNTAENILLHKNDDTEFVAENGDVYYYETAEGRFMPSDTGNGTINLYTQLVDKGYGLTTAMLASLATTGAEKVELFKQARIMKYNIESPALIHKGQSVFSRNWMEALGSTDTRTKNVYYTVRTEEDAMTFFWDDTDTIGPFTNQGQDKKPYWCEVGDRYDNGQPVWNGEQNRFFNHVEASFKEDIPQEMRNMLAAMEVLGGSKAQNSTERLYAFFHKYYFSQAQEYFPEALYNEAARVLYEKAKIKYDNGSYTNDTDPITQSLGSYYSGWKRWIKKRIQYIQSKYSYGDYSASGGDTITVRAAGADISYEITPAIWMYPNVATGTSIVKGERTAPGEKCVIVIELLGTGDQQNAIKGVHYLRSIGQWHDKNVTGTMNVKGRMLRELTLGHESEDIKISISALIVSDTPSLQVLDVRRIATLTGELALETCTHLKELLAKGTAMTNIKLPVGGPLEKIEYPSTAQYVTLRNFPLLKNEGVDISECLGEVTDFYVSECPQVKVMELLQSILNTEGHALKRIRATGFDEEYDNGEVLTALSKLTDGSYSGLTSEGKEQDGMPVLQGKMKVNAFVYEEDLEKLMEYFQGHLEIEVTGGYYMRFADPEVLKVLLANGVGDGVGITEEQAAKVTDIGVWFMGNKEINTFDEFEKFTGVTTTKINPNAPYPYNGAFARTALTSIKLPSSLTVTGAGIFAEVSTLPEIDITHVTKLGNMSFWKCSSLAKVVCPNLTEISGGAFYGCSSLESIDLSKVKVIPNQYSFNGFYYGCFQGCSSLKSVIFSEDITTMGSFAFYNCTSLEIEDFQAPNLETFGQNAFYGVKTKKISNLGKVTSLQRTGTTYGDKTTLESLNLPQTITSLGNDSEGNTFDGFINLVIEDINFPSVTYIPDGVFYNTKINKLTSLGSSTAISQTNAQKSQKGAFQASTINEVAEGVFDNITTIGSYAFTSATISGGEAELVFPNVKTIGYFAFQSLKVKKITFGSLTKIPGEGYSFACFKYCAMTELDLPDTLTEIQQYGLYECRNLTTLIIRATNPPTLGSNAFSGTPSTMTIYVPDGSVEQEVDNGDGTTSTVTKTIVELYKEASGWSDYADRIRPMSEFDVRILTYNEDGEGGYKLYQIASYDTAKNDYVMGIAVRDSTLGDIVMSKTKVSGSNVYVNTKSLSNGRINTQLMLETYPDTNYVHNKCNNYIFANGTSGYLMSKNEGFIISRKKSIINSALTLIGGSQVGDYLWTSNVGNAGNQWMGAVVTWATDRMDGGRNNQTFDTFPLTELPEGLEW